MWVLPSCSREACSPSATVVAPATVVAILPSKLGPAQNSMNISECRREDSNLHPLRDQLLKLACLPVSPRRRGGDAILEAARLGRCASLDSDDGRFDSYRSSQPAAPARALRRRRP